jgi:hypothetical protein
MTTVKDHYSQSCFTYFMKRGLVFKTSIFAVTIFFWTGSELGARLDAVASKVALAARARLL